ncbi:hypothetical protein IE53DRAFT_92938 [Violaceomyces palustris]|uniref:Uncharacterized protein n=1 Tax=Violaceomyces palustris TaxID=1673888 RepID=A0ACD0NXJ4_9BASI|nr:hypothetical protein IE53DRAFT_92938 [Violaceomyces palustris]
MVGMQGFPDLFELAWSRRSGEETLKERIWEQPTPSSDPRVLSKGEALTNSLSTFRLPTLFHLPLSNLTSFCDFLGPRSLLPPPLSEPHLLRDRKRSRSACHGHATLSSRWGAGLHSCSAFHSFSRTGIQAFGSKWKGEWEWWRKGGGKDGRLHWSERGKRCAYRDPCTWFRLIERQPFGSFVFYPFPSFLPPFFRSANCEIRWLGFES